jgi:hypothetical protein
MKRLVGDLDILGIRGTHGTESPFAHPEVAFRRGGRVLANHARKQDHYADGRRRDRRRDDRPEWRPAAPCVSIARHLEILRVLGAKLFSLTERALDFVARERSS